MKPFRETMRIKMTIVDMEAAHAQNAFRMPVYSDCFRRFRQCGRADRYGAIDYRAADQGFPGE